MPMFKRPYDAVLAEGSSELRRNVLCKRYAVDPDPQVLIVDEIAAAVQDAGHPWLADDLDATPCFNSLILDYKFPPGDPRLGPPLDCWGGVGMFEKLEGWDDREHTGPLAILSFIVAKRTNGMHKDICVFRLVNGRFESWQIERSGEQHSIGMLDRSIARFGLDGLVEPLSVGSEQQVLLGLKVVRSHLEKLLETMVRCALAAFRLMNCKNVTMVPARGLESVPYEDKREPGSVVYKTLAVNGRPMFRTEKGDGSTDLELRRHVCRGHFREYTADKPLFGRYVGRVWVPAHMRGNKSKGEVIKKYEVSP